MLSPIALVKTHPRRALLGGFGLLVAGLWAWLGLLAWIPGQVRQAVDERLAGSGFTLQWESLSVAAGGDITVQKLSIQEGLRPLLQIEKATARVSLLDLLTGKRRADRIELEQPVVYLDMVDSKPLFWQRFADALRKKAPEPETDKPKTPRAKGLGRYTRQVIIRQGQVAIGILGNAAWLFGPKLAIADVELDVAVDEGGTAALTLPKELGGGKLRAALTSDGEVLQDARGDFTPPMRWRVPGKDDKRPKGLHVTVAGVSWQAGAPALAGVALSDAATRLVALDAVGVDLEDKALLVRGVHLQVPQRVWQPYAPAGLPQEATALLGDGLLQLDLAELRGKKTGETDELQALALTAAIAGLPLRLGLVQVQRQGGQTVVRVDGPVMTIPRSAPLLAGAWQTRIDNLLALRKVAPPEAEPDTEDEEDAAVDPDAPIPSEAPESAGPKPATGKKAPGAAKATKPAAPVAATATGNNDLAVAPKGPRVPPAPGWMAALKAGQASAMGLRDKLEAVWPLAGKSEALGKLRVEVTGGQVTVVDAAGQLVIGVRNGRLGLGMGPDGVPELNVGAEPFDKIGSLGDLGLRWQRLQDGKHVLDTALTGGGLAKVLASRLPGAAVGGGASLGLWARTTVGSDKSVRVSGRLDVAKMGIQWWRLAERPIADFALSSTFELALRPNGYWSLLMPDLQLGDAQMVAEADITGVGERPRIDLRLSAPMQDCGAMLNAIPPSMTPTIGRIQASGVMGWSVHLTTRLPNVGVTQVELALADTLCTVEDMGNIDFAELQNKKWSRPVNENGKILDDVQIGPGSGSWTPMARMPGFIPYVMFTSEDSFYNHRGISESLLSKALAIDLTSGRFIYGGSTITQQLVKNLYLKRTKALSRKFEEMLIVWQIERALGKSKILELYVNAVEFGPKIYGITRAAWAFFQKNPAQLRPKEATYLAIIKPSPRSGYGTARGNGWGDWYEMKCGKYMTKLLTDGQISQQAYDEDFAEFGNWKPAFAPAPRGSSPGKPAAN